MFHELAQIINQSAESMSFVANLELHPPLQFQIPIDHRHRKLVGGYIQGQHPALTERIEDNAALVEQLIGCGALVDSKAIIWLHLGGIHHIRVADR